MLTKLTQSSDDSEAERLREEERKAEEDKNKKDSAPSTRGNVTPSGRPKHTEPLKKGPGAASRKRLGSPNVSDASGTDTSRKKAKSKHPSSQPTPQPTSRALSPTVPSGQVSFYNRYCRFIALIFYRYRLVRNASGTLQVARDRLAMLMGEPALEGR